VRGVSVRLRREKRAARRCSEDKSGFLFVPGIEYALERLVGVEEGIRFVN
jgi:hypothetical protein